MKTAVGLIALGAVILQAGAGNAARSGHRTGRPPRRQAEQGGQDHHTLPMSARSTTTAGSGSRAWMTTAAMMPSPGNKRQDQVTQPNES
jgi:hypothetical protein